MRIAIIGIGTVGTAHKKLFPNAILYDKYKNWNTTEEDVNKCDVAFIAVPTPMKKDGSCDISAVEEVVSWCECPLMIIRSTISPGTTDYLKKKYKKRIVFQPEYLGETTAHPMAKLSDRDFLILGGDKKDTAEAVKLYQTVYNASVKIYQSDAKTVELCKLMENASIGTMVTFCNEMYDIAEKMGVDYNELRELWLADPRMSRYFTFVYPDNRGFSGICLPKDINSLAYVGNSNFFKFILKHNDKIRKDIRN